MPYGELHKTRRNRNLALGAFLLGMALLFFAVTLVKLKGLT